MYFSVVSLCPSFLQVCERSESVDDARGNACPAAAEAASSPARRLEGPLGTGAVAGGRGRGSEAGGARVLFPGVFVAESRFARTPTKINKIACKEIHRYRQYMLYILGAASPLVRNLYKKCPGGGRS